MCNPTCQWRDFVDLGIWCAAEWARGRVPGAEGRGLVVGAAPGARSALAQRCHSRRASAGGGCLRCAQDWIPAFAGDADQEVRFLSGNNREVIPGLGQGILIVCFEGISCESL